VERERLLIIGASVRAAAHAAVRAEHDVVGVDLFGDLDLAAIANVSKISASEYPLGFIAAARKAGPAAWMYTGGLENYPEVVAAISEGRELLGCGPEILKNVRDPKGFRDQCISGSLPIAHRCLESEAPRMGKWVLKRRRSCGGHGIRLYEQAPYPAAGKDHYWEQYITGSPQSAVYLACECGWRPLGVTEQLIGELWTGASGFAYCGSIGPVEVTQAVWDEYRHIGAILSAGFRLRGLFGVDTLLSPEGLPHPIELNPRFTASIEVLERGLPIESVRWHVDACRNDRLPDFDWTPSKSGVMHGKAILFARRPYEISPQFAEWCAGQNDGLRWPLLADLPAAGTRIECDHPVLTYFAQGASRDEVFLELKGRCTNLIESLDRLCSSAPLTTNH
jgi:predicted ATP-grasp superfamily ATP-dependent carboligase